jgi:uncharacterized protein YutE (UPF0331/DUF86 family)
MDRERILIKINELDSYMNEIHQIMPTSFKQYQTIEKKRACERLLQISVECVIDIAALIVSGLRLGLPNGENDIFEKLVNAKIITKEMEKKLKMMKGFRNIIVHEYSRINDEIIYDILVNKLDDFKEFKEEIVGWLNRYKD